jgi:hypothetical protein
MTTKANHRKHLVKSTAEYKGYEITINVKNEGNSTIFIGKAVQIDRPMNIKKSEGSDKDFLNNELMKWVDEDVAKKNTDKIANQLYPLAEGNEKETPSVDESIPASSSNDLTAKINVGNLDKVETESVVEKNTLKVYEPNHISSIFEKSLNILTKEAERINKFLDKPHPSLANQNSILEKIEYLIKATNTNKNNLDEWRKEYTEKSQIQEKLLRDILIKIDALPQADHVSEHLTNLHNESKNLHIRLDKKIDLQDAEQILSLKNKIEESVTNQLLISLSKKIIPVVNVLKDQVVDQNTTFSKSVDNLEQRCIQAGLIPFDKLF